MKLIDVSKSTAKGKKYTATFEKDNKTKRVHFGSSNHDDYTVHHDKTRRTNYRNRHVSGKTAPADTPNALSYHLSWGDSTSMKENIKDFKKRYNV